MAKTIADPIHPGEILLEEFLRSYNPPVSQTDAAARLGWTFVVDNRPGGNGFIAVATPATSCCRAISVRD